MGSEMCIRDSWGLVLDQVSITLKECVGSDCRIAATTLELSLEPRGQCPTSFDGWFDTYWVNGPGSGADDHIAIDLGGSKSLSRFAISVGNDATESFFNGSNRARKVKLRFSDGSTQSFDLNDKAGVQELTLSSVRTSSVQISFAGIIKGASNSDFYVGEVRFWE